MATVTLLHPPSLIDRQSKQQPPYHIKMQQILCRFVVPRDLQGSRPLRHTLTTAAYRNGFLILSFSAFRKIAIDRVTRRMR